MLFYLPAFYIMYFINQSNQDVDYTEREPQTSEEVDDRLRTPICKKARTYEDGNQTHENPSLETTSKENYVHIGKTKLIDESNCKQDVNYIVRQTSEDVTRDGRPKTPMCIKARTYDIIDEYEDYHNELRSYINKNKKLEDKIAILENGVKKTKDENARLKDDKARLEEEIENLKKCSICFDGEKKYVFMPCGHYGLCKDCFDKKKSYKRKCPFCRRKIKKYNKVYRA